VLPVWSLSSRSNSLISLIKDTSLVSVIAVIELMLAIKEPISTTFQPFPLYLGTAAIYWMISLSFEQIPRRMEMRVAYPLNSGQRNFPRRRQLGALPNHVSAHVCYYMPPMPDLVWPI